MSPKAQTFFKRLFSTVILLAVLGGALAYDNPYGYAALICLFCNMTTIEWHRMLYEQREECCRWLALLCGLAYPWALALWCALYCTNHDPFCRSAALGAPVAALIVYALGAFFVMLNRMDYRALPARRALAGMGATLLAFVYPVWLFSFALIFVFQGDVRFLLLLILITKMSDIWAYVGGSLLGRRFISRPFSPAVSPKKSWEGIISSLIITELCALLIIYMLSPANLSIRSALAIAGVFALAVAGDLAGSLIKRGLGVKDSGSLLPGIGGIFDLIDSPAFTISATVALGIGLSVLSV